MDVDNITRLLRSAASGDAEAASACADLVYGDLRRLAASLMSGETAGHSLQPTALVHEAYMRLIRYGRIDWQDRAHFFAMASNQMRRILVDHARRKAAARWGGGASKLSADEDLGLSIENETDVLAVHDVLTRLETADVRLARMVVMRLFGGLTVPEIAAVRGVSIRTIQGDWATARAWLRRELAPA